MEYFAVEAKERQRAAGGDKKSSKRGGKSLPVILPEPIGESRERAAKALGISPRMVQAGKAVANLGSEPISY